ncbi:MAG TPA: S-adenosylmethionine:tRNA ribosyltransferase-isomerase [Draconibacterium sp.]|nr:S-adenosylmethionine:tRNA ribosyltransferase-isomerase [Draconibacterium sp.]
MSSFKNIQIADFTYELPDSRIAKYPLANRDESKLLLWQNGKISQDTFKNIPQFLPKGSLLVFNNTRVIHARIFFRKETGAKIEIFCLEPVDPVDYQIAFQETEKVTWKCMLGNAKKWKEGILLKSIEIKGEVVEIEASKKEQIGNSFEIEFTWTGGFSFAEIIEHAGTLPIPPYLNRETEDSDEETYQTVYAKINGSVAAPTAGLHFTEPVILQLSEKNISTCEITLHVGAGTFQPVKSDTILGHDMHHEKVIIPKSILEDLLAAPGKIIAVGTTSVRSLESLYWLGLQLENKKYFTNMPEVLQWEPYKNEASISVKKALQNLVYYMERTGQKELQFSTQVIIVPGYDFKLINGMITNFHQPQSTLLLLISAFLGEDWRKVYDYALENDFRFLSYGDSNLYLKD